MEVGERYIIEIEEVVGNLAKIKGFNALVFDEVGLNKLSKVEIDPRFLTQRGVSESLAQERQYGYNNGYKDGYEEGKKEADKKVEAARGTGYEDGHKEGYDKGYDDAKAVWYKRGYDEGKADALKERNNETTEPNEPKPHEPQIGDIYRSKINGSKIIVFYKGLSRYGTLAPDGDSYYYTSEELNFFYEFVENRADVLEPIKGALS